MILNEVHCSLAFTEDSGDWRSGRTHVIMIIYNTYV